MHSKKLTPLQSAKRKKIADAFEAVGVRPSGPVGRDLIAALACSLSIDRVNVLRDLFLWRKKNEG